MLRASANAIGQPVDVVDAMSGVDVEQAVPHAPLLVAFVDAIVEGGTTAADEARQRLAATATPAAVADAAAVLANFEMMTRVADATGAKLPQDRLASTVADRERLGIDHFESAR